MKHIMCVRLRQWSIDRLRRRHPQLRHKPLALVQTITSRLIVAAVSDEAKGSGITIGMTLAEARALCSDLCHHDHLPEHDRKSLEALGRWLIARFSPVVAIEPPDALLLDVTGSERLFGGLDRLAEQVCDALTNLQITHRIAIAPTSGAAWAVASFGAVDLSIVPEDQIAPALHPLPVAALRLDDEVVSALHHLGIETIVGLDRLPRQSLPSRFGVSLLLQLDRAFGRVAEPLVPLAHRVRVQASMQFEGGIDSPEVIGLALKHLLDCVVPQLARLGCGARRLTMHFRCDRASPITRTLSLSRPTRNVGTLLNLLRCATEALNAATGITAVTLSVPVYERVDDEQQRLLDGEEQVAQAEVDGLLERLRSRLGEDAVLCPRLIECHLPEWAVRWERPERVAFQQSPSQPITPVRSRPLHLLPEPVEVRCMLSPSDEDMGLPVLFAHDGTSHTVTQISGPERIAGVWWAGRHKTRDYYDVEDEAGRRFWLFRVAETRKWYLHGLFDG